MMPIKKKGFKYFTSGDLGVITRNTNWNRHSENYLLLSTYDEIFS